jgi:hypothetical protein
LLLGLIEADVYQIPQLHKHFNVSSNFIEIKFTNEEANNNTIYTLPSTDYLKRPNKEQINRRGKELPPKLYFTRFLQLNQTSKVVKT